MFQPDYFWAKPSRYTLFSALVADNDTKVERGVSFGNEPRLKLDIYSPASKEAPVDQAGTGPVILFIYGGSWRKGDRAFYGFLGAALASRGIPTIIPDYRLYPEVRFPGFIHDVAEAYAWTWRRFRKPDGSPRPVVVMGHSAGGHMAAMLAFNREYIKRANPDAAMPAGLVGLAGPYAFDLTTYGTTKDIFVPGQPVAETIPLNFATDAAPPTLLLHGAADTTVKVWNAEQLEGRLIDVDVPVTVKILDGVTHMGLVTRLAWPFRRRSPALDDILAFVRSLE
ncbi:MAG: alpha/beta hydrolase [Hyphomicrobiaceae bacterium]